MSSFKLGATDPVFVVNGVRIIVRSTPIEVEAGASKPDAIVSSDDTQLTMGGGVSGAILIAAGPALASEAARLTPLSVGDVVATPAGRLPIRFVLHAATVDWERGIRPTAGTIRLAAENVFRLCETLQIRRVGVPALGTGAAGFSSVESAKLTLATLVQHTTNPTLIEEVVFCLPEPTIRQAFEAELRLSESADTAGMQDGASIPTRVTHSPLGATKRRFWRRRRESSSETEQTASAVPVIHTDSTTPGDDSSQYSPRVVVGGATRPVVSNRYVLLEEIGRGGMGIVYLAWDSALKFLVAIKTLRPEKEMNRDRVEALRREAAVQMGLVHEGIVRLFHFEPWDQLVGPYVTMEYLRWKSGDRWLAEAGLEGVPVQSVLRVGVRLCEALACAHSSNVIHGDIKPSNVFIDPAAERAKIADFGIARVVESRQPHALVTKLVGTPR